MAPPVGPSLPPLLGLELLAAMAMAVPVLTIDSVLNGALNGDYTTSKFFVDELAGDSILLTVTFSPDAAGVTAVEIFTNLNRRDRAGLDANADGIEDGILPPSGDLVVAVAMRSTTEPTRLLRLAVASIRWSWPRRRPVPTGSRRATKSRDRTI